MNTLYSILDQNELAYYTRHLSLDAIGIKGQKKLKNARVLCVGAGGLGCPLLLYLAGAGVGTMGIIDGDNIEISNLHRQILYSIDEIGLPKASIAEKKIKQLNPHIQTVSHSYQLTAENAQEIIASYDIIVDCTDNFAARYLINDICFHLHKPNVQASITQFDGYCTVFTANGGPCYRCLFNEIPSSNLFPNCAEAGVLGVLPGILGSIQAMEVIKLITGIGKSLVGRLLKLETLTMKFTEFVLEKNLNCPLCYQQQSFETLARPTNNCEKPSCNDIGISPMQLKTLQKQQSVFILDVREPYEYASYNLGGYLIPLPELPHRLLELNPNDTIVIHCKTSPRSQTACQILKQAGFKSVFYLVGGIVAWQAEIDIS